MLQHVHAIRLVLITAVLAMPVAAHAQVNPVTSGVDAAAEAMAGWLAGQRQAEIDRQNRTLAEAQIRALEAQAAAAEARARAYEAPAPISMSRGVCAGFEPEMTPEHRAFALRILTADDPDAPMIGVQGTETGLQGGEKSAAERLASMEAAGVPVEWLRCQAVFALLESPIR